MSEGIKLLDAEAIKKVSSDLESLDDIELITRVERYETMPTCLSLVKALLVLRGYKEVTTWVKNE